MMHIVIMTVFLAGLMVGRTPEYLGKKIERERMQMVIVSILLPSAAMLHRHRSGMCFAGSTFKFIRQRAARFQ